MVGGIDGADILGMSGGWQRSFNLASAEDVSLTFRYRMEQTHGYESDEFSQVLVSIDGTLIGTMGNDYVVQLTGDGPGGVGQVRTTGDWQQIRLDLGTLGAGAHTLIIGGYNNKKTLADEETTIWIDDVGITTVVPIVCGDAIVSPGEDCDDGGTEDGDCCSSVCTFEVFGSSCSDLDACSELEICDGAGMCIGDPVTCDDGNACTSDSCDAMLGCAFEPIPGCAAAIPASGPAGRIALAALLAGLGGLGAMRSRTGRAGRGVMRSRAGGAGTRRPAAGAHLRAAALRWCAATTQNSYAARTRSGSAIASASCANFSSTWCASSASTRTSRIASACTRPVTG